MPWSGTVSWVTGHKMCPLSALYDTAVPSVLNSYSYTTTYIVCWINKSNAWHILGRIAIVLDRTKLRQLKAVVCQGFIGITKIVFLLDGSARQKTGRNWAENRQTSRRNPDSVRAGQPIRNDYKTQEKATTMTDFKIENRRKFVKPVLTTSQRQRNDWFHRQTAVDKLL